MAFELVGLRYMTEFACVGPACADPCCSGWSIEVDEDHYRALEARMTTPLERDQFERAFVREPPERSMRLRFAKVALDASNKCTMFDADGMCAIQRRYGEHYLPNTCAVYPRSVGRIDDRIELSGTMACPEAARRALLTRDAVDFVSIPSQLFVRRLILKSVSSSAGCYERWLPAVRQTALDLLSGPSSVMSRLFCLAFLGSETAHYFRRDGAFDEAHLEQLVDGLRRPQLVEGLQRRFTAVNTDDVFAASVIVQVLLAKRPAQATRFSSLVGRVLDGYSEGEADMELSALWHAFLRRRAALPAVVGERLELYTRNFSINYLVRQFYTEEHSLIDYLFLLFVAVAVTRFLFVSHPALAELASAPERAVEIADAVAVEVFQSYARAIQHDSMLSRRVVEALARHDQRSVFHAIALLRV